MSLTRDYNLFGKLAIISIVLVSLFPSLGLFGLSYFSVAFQFVILSTFILSDRKTLIVSFVLICTMVLSVLKSYIFSLNSFDIKSILNFSRALILSSAAGLVIFLKRRNNPDALPMAIAFIILIDFILVFGVLRDYKFIQELQLLYSEGDVYTIGYAKWRSIGLSGQPGKHGIFIAFMVFSHLQLSQNRITRLIVLLLGGFCVVTSLSRIAIFTFMILVSLWFLKRNGFIRWLLCAVTVCLISFNAVSSDIQDGLSRGLKKGNSGNTGSYRIQLKQWALYEVSDPFDFVFGVNVDEEHLLGLEKPEFVQGDLNLKDADSSATVEFVRYGVSGVMFWLLLLLVTHNRLFETYTVEHYVYVGLILLLYNLDPILDDTRLVMSTLLGAYSISN